MLQKVFAVITTVSIVFALFSGNAENLSPAVLDGCSRAVNLVISLCGTMCLWSGFMQVLSDAGIVGRLSKLLMPLLRFAFPRASKSGRGLKEISANIAANMLGIGNAATPFALAAIQKLQEDNEKPDIATNDEITLAVLNTSSFCLLPGTIIAMRYAVGASAAAVIPPIWICSLCGSLFALMCAKGISKKRE